MLLRHPRTLRTRLCTWIASAAMVAALTVAAPTAGAAAASQAATPAAAQAATPTPGQAHSPLAGPTSTARATTAAMSSSDCSALAVGGYCSFSYADFPNQTTFTIPETVNTITVLLSGGSGAGGSTKGGGGQGGSVMATITLAPSTTDRSLDLWLGGSGHGRDRGGQGWADGGPGGVGVGGDDGGSGGGASALAWSSAGHDDPLMVAGGGGGGGHDIDGFAHNGGVGGAGGNPPGNGLRGTSGGIWGPGGKGGGSGSSHGDAGGGGSDSDFTGGGGGGGGYRHGGGGGEAGGVAYGDYQAGSGGGGGGGASFAKGVTVHTYGVGPFGDGSLMIFGGSPQRYDCVDTHNPRTLTIPAGVSAYGFIAVGGAGEHGSNKAPGGTGALASGILNVDGLNTLDYWVGCTDYGGAGYSYRGHGGDAGDGGNDGGNGGGATLIASNNYPTPSSNTVLVAAGGGGGSGGDASNCDHYPSQYCGGQGGSGGGVNGTRYTYDGQEGGGNGGDGGYANHHTEHGKPYPHGGDGTSSGIDTGAGGGGGAGWPKGGDGGHHATFTPGGGGGAGGSYLSSQRVTGGSISASGTNTNGYILLLPIKPAKTDLTVTKAVNGNAAAYGYGPFTIDVTCTLDGHSTLKETITLGPGGSHLFPGVPTGSSCVANETGAGGASSPASEAQVTLGMNPATLTLVNGFEATSFTISVFSAIRGENGAPDPDVAITLGDLGVHVACTFNGRPIVLPAPVLNGQLDFAGQKTWVSGGQTFTINGMPVGAQCTAKLAAGSGATETLYAVDGSSPAGDAATFTLDFATTNVQVTDVYELAPLTVTKLADGDSTPPADVSYPGTVSCTFQGRPVMLPASASFSIGIGTSQFVHNLPIGAQCTVTETNAHGAAATTYAPAQTVPITADADPVASVTVTNTFDAHTLLVSIGTSGAGASWANEPYRVHVTCASASGTVLDTTFRTHDTFGGWAAFDVESGAVCSATETSSGGASSVAYASSVNPTRGGSPVSVAIPTHGSVSLTIDNEYTAAELRVATTTTGAGAIYASASDAGAIGASASDAGDPTTVTVSQCTFNGLPIEILPGQTSVAFALPAGGGAAAIPELVTGALCAVTETDAAGATATATATSTSYATANADPSSALPDGGMQVTVNQSVAGTPTTVNIDNRFDLAALTVGTTVAGPAAWAANAPYQVNVQCTFANEPVLRLGPDGIAVLQFTADGALVPNYGSEALQTLSVGTQCSALEQTTGGATTVSYNPPDASGTRSGSVTVPSMGTSIGVTNTFAATTLTATKILTGNDAPAHSADVFFFDTACTFNGRILPSPPDDPRSEVFTLIGGESQAFTELPVGANCSVNEFDDEHATAVTPRHDQTVVLTTTPAVLTFTNAFDVTPLAVTEVLTGAGAATYGAGQTFAAQVECVWSNEFNERVELPNNGRVELSAADHFTAVFNAPVGVECSVSQGLQLATAQTASGPITLQAGSGNELSVSSEYRIGPISVTKTAHGVFPAGQKFGFATQCVWPSGSAGVVGTGSGAAGSGGAGPVVLPLNGNQAGAFTLKSGDTRVLQALAGARCSVTETDSGGAVRVVVDAHGRDASTSAQTASVRITTGATGTMTFTNFMPGSLPATGSEISWTLAAALILLLGGLALIFARRRLSTRRGKRTTSS
ncbi:DUF5979 domain-containing protein [Rathayibacter soli]|uniref:DUF5979 domain-containing protein n=1 Tax=Rathayibacter soli TaxID=3144168 RepID=UPI0027E57A30|nr:DUF5979 domain-containing protein [Glaciibacter superstes]